MILYEKEHFRRKWRKGRKRKRIVCVLGEKRDGKEEEDDKKMEGRGGVQREDEESNR